MLDDRSALVGYRHADFDTVTSSAAMVDEVASFHQVVECGTNYDNPGSRAGE